MWILKGNYNSKAFSHQIQGQKMTIFGPKMYQNALPQIPRVTDPRKMTIFGTWPNLPKNGPSLEDVLKVSSWAPFGLIFAPLESWESGLSIGAKIRSIGAQEGIFKTVWSWRWFGGWDRKSRKSMKMQTKIMYEGAPCWKTRAGRLVFKYPPI